MPGYDDRLDEAMRQLGWRWDERSQGFVRGGKDWVTRTQAEEALRAAEMGGGQAIVPASRTVAEMMGKGANDA